MIDARAEDEPGLTLTPAEDDLLDDAHVLRRRIHALRQLRLDEVAAALVNAVGVIRQLGVLRLQRREIARLYQLAHVRRLDEVAEESGRVCNQAVPEPVRRGGETDHPQGGVDG